MTTRTAATAAVLFTLLLSWRTAGALQETVTTPPASPPQAGPASTPQSPPSPPASRQVLIGVIDIQKIGTESKIGRAERKRFEARGEKLKGEIEARGKKLEKEKKALEEKFPSLQPDQRQAKAKEFEKKVEAYRKMVQKAQEEMEPLQKEINDKLFALVEKGAARVGSAKGLALIVPRRDLIFSSPDTTIVDVTEDLLTVVDELYDAK